jgi:hypothetical protein
LQNSCARNKKIFFFSHSQKKYFSFYIHKKIENKKMTSFAPGDLVKVVKVIQVSDKIRNEMKETCIGMMFRIHQVSQAGCYNGQIYRLDAMDAYNFHADELEKVDAPLSFPSVQVGDFVRVAGEMGVYEVRDVKTEVKVATADCVVKMTKHFCVVPREEALAFKRTKLLQEATEATKKSNEAVALAARLFGEIGAIDLQIAEQASKSATK